jgi:hypothetical protein
MRQAKTILPVRCIQATKIQTVSKNKTVFNIPQLSRRTVGMPALHAVPVRLSLSKGNTLLSKGNTIVYI